MWNAGYSHGFVYFCTVKIKEAICALENFAPLPLQESYDNAGLQIGLTERELSGALLCLDVTEDVLMKAIHEGYNLVVAHHPLLFHGLKRIGDEDYIQHIVLEAIKHDVVIYAAHTNLDNARGGVNFRAAELLGLGNVDFLRPLPDGSGGSGVVGELPSTMEPDVFSHLVKHTFKAEWLLHTACEHGEIKRVAICCGAGAFMLDDAVAAGADAFITGEIGHHAYFNYQDRLQICALGHYQSEIHVTDLLRDILHAEFPDLRLETFRATNPERIITN